MRMPETVGKDPDHLDLDFRAAIDKRNRALAEGLGRRHIPAQPSLQSGCFLASST
jgi:hypothetical protein